MEKKTYSYHIFYFPFKWQMKEQGDELFETKVSLNNIYPSSSYSNWERISSPDNETELYDEKNYYFEFVHDVLYDTGKDNTLIKHYERKEPKTAGSKVTYNIAIKRNAKTYVLEIDDIALNFYSTGVGTLIFYIRNCGENQKDFANIKLINQYGRRIMPPFIDDVNMRSEIAEYISIEGLNGGNYKEDFNEYRAHKKAWQPAKFISQLIADFSEELSITPVIDDRMTVSCWYANNQFSEDIKTNFSSSKTKQDWYAYAFIDSESPTCQNKEMLDELVKQSTNMRWQNQGTIYGVTRYSFVAMGPENDFFCNIIQKHTRTIYSRMMELVLVQRASMLKFSDEVTKVSNLEGKNEQIIADYIGSLYKEYIRFVNQFYFRQVTSQDQGIELYQMMLNQFDSKDQIKDLDNEIGELHDYFSILIDHKRNKNSETLNIIAAIFLPATLISSIFGMNSEPVLKLSFLSQFFTIAIVTIASLYFVKRIKK